MVGNNIPGIDYWYNDNDIKVGSSYPTNGETINVIYARVWNTGYMDAVAKAIIYNSATHALITVSDEVFIPVTQTTPSYVTFSLPSSVTLPVGNCIFGVIIGKGPAVPGWAGAALFFGYTATAYSNGIRNTDAYADGPSAIFEASDPNIPISYAKDFDIYAYSAGAGPTANYSVSPQNVKSGQPMTFDGSLSVQGANPIISYVWDFGDGQSTQGILVTHTYSPATNTAYIVKLTVTDSGGLSSSVSYIIGVFNLGATIIADFENPTDFMAGDNSIWEPTSYPLKNPNNTITPDVSLPIHPDGSGTTSAKLSLLNPASVVGGVEGKRLEFLHRWDPVATRGMWLEAWIYLPSDYPQTNQWNAFFRPIYERCWLRGYQESFQHVLSIYLDGRSGRPTYKQQIFILTLCQGDVYGGGLVQEEFYPVDTDPTVKPPFGQWFYVRSYTYRDPANWGNGIFRLWMALPPDYTLKLLVDRSPVRTIGIDPSLMAQATANYLRDGYFCSGFSNYMDAVNPPTSVYFDDIVLSGVPLGPIQDYWNLNVSASPASGGIVAPSGSISIVQGQSVTVNATPYSGYMIQGWEFDGVGYPTSPSFTVPAQAINTTHTLIAYFTPLPPPAKGIIEVHAFLNGVEVVASGLVVETGEAFNTPASLTEDPGAYTVRVTLLGASMDKIAQVISEQTIRVDFQFQTAPIPPGIHWIPLGIGTGLILLST